MALMRYLSRRSSFFLYIALPCYVLFTVYAFCVLYTTFDGEKRSVLIRSMPNKCPPENQKETFQDVVLERIDWNNYSLMERDSKRTGLGEQGIGVTLNLTSEQTIKRQELLDKYKYDAYLADRVSLERSIGDIRPEDCKRLTHMKDIPKNSVSVIIPLFNEKNSTLLRTIHSIINRSPASLLKEIIVVDDFSQEEELKAPLDDYVREHFGKVTVIRNKQREGLIRSRIIGADASTGSFLVFLDSHVEVNYNYLPPLLEIVALNYRTIACPTVDFVEGDYIVRTLAEKRARGAFDWNLDFFRMPVTVPMDEITPHDNPIMVGCAFVISRKWWEELGKYDPGLEIWGAEQYELSVKSWLCGGSVVDLPCSRIAHLFRPWPYLDDIKAVFAKNFVRFASVWMDGFREVLLNRKPHWRNIHPGNDILKQVELRERLKCKPFDWFLTEVAPDILEFFPIVEPSPLAWGHLISKSNSSLCANIKENGAFLVDCKNEQISVFTYDWRHHIVDKRNQCFNAILPDYLIIGEYIEIEVEPKQSFSWDPKSGLIVNFHSRLCIDFKPESLKLFMSDCVDNKTSQSWRFEYVNGSRVDEEWDKYTQTVHTL